MSGLNEWNQRNQQVIADFRATEGRLGDDFAAAPVVLVHHVGRRSGKEYVIPLVYLPKDGDDESVYIFATKGGAPAHPDWYLNLIAAGQATIEVGASTYLVTISELSGGERDRVYAEQVRLMPGFGEYATKTAGIRTIPVLELTRR